MAETKGESKAESKADKDRRQALELALSQIERQFGKGAVMKLGSSGALEETAVVPTGALTIDLALGIGGIPRGRVTEIYGPESSGKTTLALHVIAEAQRSGGYAAFIDAEHALDAAYAKRLGVNIDELLISQPDTGEQALEIAEHLVRSGAIDVIVIDSVAALVPKAELEGEMGDSLPGLQARLMSQALRKLTAAIARSGTAVVFINQIREKIGVMFGSPETTPGGRALKFYASVRLDIRRMDALKQGTESVGVHTKVKVVKNKLAAAVPRGRVRRHVRRGDLARGQRAGPGRGAGDRREERHVVLVPRPAHRPGARQRPEVPQGEPEGPGRDGDGGAPRGRAQARRERGLTAGAGPAPGPGAPGDRPSAGARPAAARSRWTARRARAVALDLLARKPWTRRDLARRLRRRGAPADVAEAVVADLEARGYVDDRAFAADVGRGRGRGSGPSAASGCARSWWPAASRARSSRRPSRAPSRTRTS